MPAPCPYCGAKEDYFYRIEMRDPMKCPRCGRTDTHYHDGVQKPAACGPLIGFWARLFRWCWLKNPHIHCSCSVCGGKWISPPVGAKGEIMLTKPKKPKNRYQRDPVI